MGTGESRRRSAGRQQGPILAAAGAEVTIFGNPPRLLEQDHHVAELDDIAYERGESSHHIEWRSIAGTRDRGLVEDRVRSNTPGGPPHSSDTHPSA